MKIAHQIFLLMVVVSVVTQLPAASAQLVAFGARNNPSVQFINQQPSVSRVGTIECKTTRCQVLKIKPDESTKRLKNNSVMNLTWTDRVKICKRALYLPLDKQPIMAALIASACAPITVVADRFESPYIGLAAKIGAIESNFLMIYWIAYNYVDQRCAYLAEKDYF
ncbi:MAG TPA: hypothetical protein VGT41_03975 [Candidatus Babeliales bacterium]|nr:hypothetical protein [Candidatus Babeliales bacterium]